jgi:WD40 repeat protein
VTHFETESACKFGRVTMRVLTTRHQKVERVAFSTDGAHLFTSGLHAGSLGYGDKDSGIDVFDLAGDSTPAAHLLTGHDVSWFASLPDGRLVVNHFGFADNGGSRGRTVSVLDWRTDRAVRVGANGWRIDGACGVSSDGRRIVAEMGGAGGHDMRGDFAAEQGIGRWALSGAGVLRLDWHINLGFNHQIRAVAYGSDGLSFWTAEYVVSRTVPHWRIELVPRDADTGTATRAPVAYPNQNISGLALAPNGRFAVAHDGASLFVYDLAKLDRKPKKLTNPAKRKHFGGFAVHPSANWLATAGLDGAVTVWDTATRKVARSWVWDAGQARSITFSADGTLAAAGTGTGKVVVWDLDL